jgi:hypothetical protein
MRENPLIKPGKLFKLPEPPLNKYSSWPIDPYSEAHIGRNKYNYCPKRPPSDCSGTFVDHKGEEWRRDSLIGGIYHGSLFGYETFRNPNTGSQCTYAPGGAFVDFPPFMGTYDYNSPYKTRYYNEPELHYFWKHQDTDVKPHRVNPNYKPYLSITY